MGGSDGKLTASGLILAHKCCLSCNFFKKLSQYLNTRVFVFFYMSLWVFRFS